MENKHSIERLVLTLSQLTRYSTTPSLIPESVSDHCFMISFMIIEFSCKYPELFKYLNREELLIRATLHDACEAVSGDICNLFKQLTKRNEEFFENSEEEIIEEICKGRNDEFKSLLKLSVSNSLKGSKNEIFLKLLDTYCVLIKTNNELEMSNRHYTRVYYSVMKSLTTAIENIAILGDIECNNENKKFYSLLSSFIHDEMITKLKEIGDKFSL